MEQGPISNWGADGRSTPMKRKGPLWSEQEIRIRHYHEEVDRYMNGEK